MRLAYATSVLAVLVVAQVSPAAPPQTPGPKLVKVGEPFEVEFTEDAAGPAVVFSPYKADELFWREAAPTKKGTRAFIGFVRKPGTYRLTCWTKGDTVGDALPVAYFDITTTETPEPVPPPKPIPEPKPPEPKPEPVAAAWVIVVEETTQRTPAHVAVLHDTAMWGRLKAKGVQFRIYDKDSPDVKAKNYTAMVDGVALPAVLLLDATGKRLAAFTLTTGADLEARVK